MTKTKNQCPGQVQITCEHKDTCVDGCRRVDTYRAHIEAFNQRKRARPVSMSARALFYGLLEHQNEIGWPEKFSVQDRQLCALADIARSTLNRSREELESAGYIAYEGAAGSQSGTYRLTIL
jgi:hypothetical protein